MHTVEYIPAGWLEHAAWAARCGERMAVYSRPVQIEPPRRATDSRPPDDE